MAVNSNSLERNSSVPGKKFFLALLLGIILISIFYWRLTNEFFHVPPYRCLTDRLINNVSMDCRTPQYRPSVIIYVHSALDHFVHRRIIRYTWGHPELAATMGFITVFMLGSTLDPSLQKAIDEEKRAFGDIVQMTFLDTYHNLSYKAMGAMRWVLSHCRDYSFVVKTDDDVMVNVFGLFDFLRKKQTAVPSRTLLCYAIHPNVIRDKSSKWFVSEDEFPDQRYPTYCVGLAYIFLNDTLGPLCNASLSVPFLWVDDVYSTGMLAKEAGVGHKSIHQYYMYGDDKRKEIVDGKFFFVLVEGDRGISSRLLLWEQLASKYLDHKLP